MDYHMSDVTENGIVISDIKNNFIMAVKEKKVRVFNNLEVAKVMSKILVPDKAAFKYYIQVLLPDGRLLLKDVGDCQYIDGRYEFFFENQMFRVFEKTDRRSTTVGYILFDDADQTYIDREEGRKKQYELMGEIRAASEFVFKHQNDISKFLKARKGFGFRLTNSTTEIHIITISKLMGINQLRKTENVSCFPFLRNIDKFRGFYVVIDKDIAESFKSDSISRSLEILEQIIAVIKDSSGLNVRFMRLDDGTYYYPLKKGELEWEES